MTERVGKAIEERAERIQRCIRASRRSEKLDMIATGSELTFLPTTRGMGGSMLTRTGIRSLGLPRVLAAAAVLLVVGLVGTMSLTSSDDTPDAPKAAARPAGPATSLPPPVARSMDKPASTAPEPSEAEKAPAAAERRAPLSLPEAMARALAEKREKERRDASGSSVNDTRGGAASAERGSRSGSSTSARGGSRRGSLSSKIGPLEHEL
jgi:hypothetical protein